jgi:hypothetical protein
LNALYSPTLGDRVERGTQATKGLDQRSDGAFAHPSVAAQNYLSAGLGGPVGHSESVGGSGRARIGTPNPIGANWSREHPKHRVHVVVPEGIGQRK